MSAVATPPRPDLGAVLVPNRPAHVRVSTAQAVYVIWYRDLIRYWRDRTRLVTSLAQPVLFLLVFGVGLNSSLSGALRLPAGTSYIQYIYPGVIAMAVLFTAMFSAVSLVWDREFGFLREILVAPIKRSAVAIGKALGGATQAIIQGLIMLVFAPIVGVKLDALSVLELIPLLFVLAFAITCLGVALASRLKSMQGFQAVMTLLMMPMFFLSGAMFALNGLPDWMTVLTRLDPVSYGVAPIRVALLSGAGVPAQALDRFAGVSIGGRTLPVIVDVLILLAFGAVFLAISMRALRRRD
jgi:ABC-2 type transport system permease protein